jgi:ABC-type dipeptide/oligopeptide/nickel transport system permease subunit
VSPWAVLAPGGAIFITVLGFNLLADGLSDAFNPRLKQ